jgi:hypothetical protein
MPPPVVKVTASPMVAAAPAAPVPQASAPWPFPFPRPTPCTNCPAAIVNTNFILTLYLSDQTNLILHLGSPTAADCANRWQGWTRPSDATHVFFLLNSTDTVNWSPCWQATGDLGAAFILTNGIDFNVSEMLFKAGCTNQAGSNQP